MRSKQCVKIRRRMSLFGKKKKEQTQSKVQLLDEDIQAQEDIEDKEGKDKSFNPYKDTYEWLHCIVVAMIVCVLLFVMVARVIDVRGGSMEPTLIDGDKIIITRWAGDYEQGDIVVLQKNSFRAEPIVKRIIGVEGQTITIDFAAGSVTVDGVELNEPYTKERTYDSYDIVRPEYFDVYGIDADKDITETTVTVTVPEGCVFVMGDNRNNSSDSRVATIGCVDTRYIMGKAIFRIYPFGKLGAIYGSSING